jgi:putative transposase
LAGRQSDGDEIDILVQKRKDKTVTPIKIVTDKLRNYSAAKKELIPDVEHATQ